MATIVKGTVESISGVDYNVYLDNGAPDAGGTTLSVRSAKLTYRSETEDVDAHLLTSKMSITFSVHNTTELALFDGLIDAKELDYKLRIEREGVLWWVGFVLLDLVSVDFAQFPFDVKISATDGVSRLKDIDYELGALSEFATLKEHLFNVLTQMPLSDYYGAGDEYLRVHSTLVPEGMTPGVNIFNKVRVGIKALRTVDKRGRVKYTSYYNALLEFLQMLNARMVYSQGRYLITEIADYARPLDDVTFYRYNEAGTELAQEDLVNWTTYIKQIGPTLAGSDAVALARGQTTQYPPLKAVEYTYKHYSRQNLFPAYNGQTLVNATSYQEILSFDTDGGAGTISISGNVAGSFTAQATALPANSQVFVRLAVSLVIVDADDNNVGTSLRRNVTITSNGYSYQPIEWVDGNIAALAYFMLPLPPRSATNSGTAGFTINTPAVPRSGTLRFAITHEGVFVDGTEYDPSTVTVTLQEFFMESILTGSIEDQYNYTYWPVETAASGFNSLVLEREALFGDGPGDNTFGRIEYTENGTDWLRTDRWRRWSGVYLNATAMVHTNMIAGLTLALQDTRRRVLDITVIGDDYQAEFLLGSQSSLYLMQSGELNLGNDEWRGRWFEIAANFVDTVTVGEPTETDPVAGPGGSTDGPDLPGPGGGFDPPDPPITGNSAPGINTVPTTVGTGLAAGDEITTVDLSNLTNVPLFAGDVVVVTNQVTGQTQTFTVAYDSDLGVPDPNQVIPDVTSIPYYGEDGLVWLIPDTGTVAVVSDIADVDFPAGSYVQPDPVFTAQLQALLRTDHYDFHIFDYDTTITTGFVGPFWRAGNRIGWGIRKVQFSFAQDLGATAVKVNLKYYDATGYRYTVATFNSNGLGGIEDAFADVAVGYYRVEVETITGTAPKGLVVSIQMIKQN